MVAGYTCQREPDVFRRRLGSWKAASSRGASYSESVSGYHLPCGKGTSGNTTGTLILTEGVVMTLATLCTTAMLNTQCAIAQFGLRVPRIIVTSSTGLTEQSKAAYYVWGTVWSFISPTTTKRRQRPWYFMTPPQRLRARKGPWRATLASWMARRYACHHMGQKWYYYPMLLYSPGMRRRESIAP
ncbi:hypothetical protein M408DRAFT_85573 [Serendipita vermifera MAFF 305830]|uniref:Uncharacterized protein n=1 Tax=Serendipita vermifera MAFF 305830 TaxID=933852 RepID=A0A0C2XY71_SERVB|nr:hypothetical protein M408DRAFT_85573 [Serendipita vermifera MAFF 305830]